MVTPYRSTPGLPFLLTLPNDAYLLGLQMSAQGLTLDWNWGLHLTNATDITAGTHGCRADALRVRGDR